MRRAAPLAAVILACASPGCAALGLFDDPVAIPCADDEPCAELDGPCSIGRCTSAGFCEIARRDDDRDHEAPLGCADEAALPATDCDDGDALTAASALDTCNGRDDDCDAAIDEACPAIDDVDAGYFHACAVRAGEVLCWGAGPGVGQGQLALGRSIPGRVDGVEGAIRVVTDLATSCALERDGDVVCWGAPDRSPIPAESPLGVAVAIALPGPARSLVLDSGHACVLLEDRTLWCWSGPAGLGDVWASGQGIPYEVDSAGDIVDAAAGENLTCFLRESGELACAGMNLDQVVTAGFDFGPYRAPVVRVDLPRVVDVEIAATTACALDVDGAVWCWGNDFGPLGSVPLVRSVASAVRLDGFPRARALRMRAFQAFDLCAMAIDGGAVCVGPRFGSTTPIAFPAFDGTDRIAISDTFTCALAFPGPLRCSGANMLGMLGDGTLEDRSEPTEVRGL